MRKLYTQGKTREILFDALAEDLFAVFFAHMDLVNAHKPGYISELFDPERAAALFENAKAIAEKRCDLLVQALSLCRWNAELVRYIFVNYPEERREISAVAHRFRVDLSAVFEALLEKEYSEEARSSEEAAQTAKAKICSIMAEYHSEKSATLDRLEGDCLERLCSGVESADKAECLAIQEHLRGYDALEKNKAPFLSRLQQRIEDIWSAEDGALFEKLHLDTDINDPAAVAKTLEEVKRAARTAASDGYISALETCTERDIHKARIFQRGVRPRLYAVIG